VREKLEGKKETRFVAVEPTACPTLTKGLYAYDYGDTGGLAPLVKMYTLGHTFVPPGIHAGGLRYHGMSPTICLLYDQGIMEAVAYRQNPVFESAQLFAQVEGIVPAPESAHAVRSAVDEALKAKEEGAERAILFNLSGHGLFDLAAYDSYLTGNLEDFEQSPEYLQQCLKELPEVSA
jgi:tryptophan synthase beta chain